MIIGFGKQKPTTENYDLSPIMVTESHLPAIRWQINCVPKILCVRCGSVDTWKRSKNVEHHIIRYNFFVNI